ncbi:isopenicillin N synthase family oxygenase [Kaistia algarum]|uniref:isopenicillin N synthase family dioxygenase n=1 Tax=Kaistia algarum TaxID=2083279 RepID=UPI000CE78F6D|nr:2-oxoglutarate and iron-dependent oxygenase domain-containing protein [Kaistia algarum]MCX5516701.1 isopenicillin N synthase family oxygenase [Kaistia algarum]PPE78592.1 isopenicillin N synthase family oxygenase [Kaistia algarum]
MTQSLPIIDISGLVAGKPGAVTAVAAEIGQAAREIGFFYVAGHGISGERFEHLFETARRFFALPLDKKQEVAFAKSKHNRGFIAMKGESLDPSKPADLKEGFNIGLDLAPDDPRILAGEPFRGANLWPDMPGFRETMLDYFGGVLKVGQCLQRAVAVDVGLPEDFFEDKLDQSLSTLRLLHYPPQPASIEPGQLGAGEHTDYGCLTLLMTDDVGGLEVRRRDGAWLAAPPIADVFVCNIGDCLMRWTNDVYVSTPHRVVNRSGRERYSIPFFLDPNPDAPVVSIPSCVSPERPSRYPPTTGAEYLRERLTRTYAPGMIA